MLRRLPRQIALGRLMRLLLSIAASLLLLASPPSRASEEGRLSESEMLAFLVQCIGTGPNGSPSIVSRPGSSCRTPQEVASKPDWRKHDWPDRRDPAVQPLGHQASDSVLDRGFPFPAVVQTFDFGDAGRRFGVKDEGQGGDGGDAVAILKGAAWVFFTEDGGNGRQWFVAEACRTAPGPNAAHESWLLFDNTVTRHGWRDRLARLRITRSPHECPDRFSNAYTRFRRATIPVPYRAVAGSQPVRTGTWKVDSIVSDHFGGRSIESADHLERFYFGRGLGKYRWERWEELSRSRQPDVPGRARTLAESGRCMPLPYSDAPGPGWVMIDCRTWTNLVRQRAKWSASELGWPGTAVDAIRSGAGRPRSP